MNQLFTDKNVQVLDNVKNWEEAVRKASQPLIADKAISEEYVNNMINSVQRNGPYMVLTDYFALMHARPGEGVNRKGMSLLVVRDPVDLEGKPVKIFLIMAATDNTSHLSSLQKIMEIFMNSESYQTILNGNKEEILNLFKEEIKS